MSLFDRPSAHDYAVLRGGQPPKQCPYMIVEYNGHGIRRQCKKNEIPGVGWCFYHTPENLIPLLEEITGKVRCPVIVSAIEGIRVEGRCGAQVPNGLDTCIKHRLKARKHYKPNVKNAKAVIVLETLKRDGFYQGDVSTVTNPLEALLGVAAEVLELKDIIKEEVAKLRTDEWRYEGTRTGEQIRGEIVLYERALDRAANVLARITRLGIEDRLAKVSERQAVIIEKAIIRALDDIGIDAITQDAARKKIIKYLQIAA
jgi:hypothetical protein